jgi:predicted Zn-dependent peptidase
LENILPPSIFTISNGIRIVHQPMARAVGHCGLMIACGSRDELAHEHGLAHFIEHGMFKGTKKRNNTQILSRLDAVGGEINAFTAKEETWIHASFLHEHTERAIELIADIALHSTFPLAELEKEKDVIIDEINGYKDSPTDMMFEEMDEHLFPNHPLGRSILGTEQSVKGFKHKDAMNFYQRCFISQNMIFSYAGPLKADQLKIWCEKYLSAAPKVVVQYNRPKFHAFKKQKIVQHKEIHQAHYGWGGLAPSLHNKERHGFILLNNLLGGPAMNNILNLKIREKHGIAYQVDSNYSPFSDTGVFSIYLGTEEHQLNKAIALIEAELKKLREQPLSSRALNGYKTQLKGQLALSQDSGASLMFNNGKSLWVYDRINTMKEVFDVIDGITANQLCELSERFLNPVHFFSMAYLPVKD